jgi:hypothetical protein
MFPSMFQSAPPRLDYGQGTLPMTTSKYSIGMIVEHPNKPEWGPGKIQALSQTQAVVYFRNFPEKEPGEAQKIISLDYISLSISPIQSDPLLDNLPPYKEGYKPAKTRFTLKQGIDKFLQIFPAGFNDKSYKTDKEVGERQYKWEAHLHYTKLLAKNQFRKLLSSNDIDECTRRILAVASKTNLLSIFEKAAFRDAMKVKDSALKYLNSLFELIEQGPRQHVCNTYFAAVTDLPAQQGKTRVATWPVATVLPYLAKPHSFMFLKPDVTKECAARLNFNLSYNAAPNWLTYHKLLLMCDILMEQLKPLGAKDMIDLQSFIWVIGRC